MFLLKEQTKVMPPGCIQITLVFLDKRLILVSHNWVCTCLLKRSSSPPLPLLVRALPFFLGGTREELFCSLFHQQNYHLVFAIWYCVTETQCTMYLLSCSQTTLMTSNLRKNIRSSVSDWSGVSHPPVTFLYKLIHLSDYVARL